MVYHSLLRPLLFQMEAEKAHDLAHRFGKTASGSDILKLLAHLVYGYEAPELTQNFWGLTFPNPIGLAAGFDKNGHLPEIMESIGMGFAEVGSITANPNTGNPKPRMFRLPDDEALINRMGLNNDGAKTIVKRLKNKSVSIPLGINIAKTHDPTITGDAAIRDYQFSFREAQNIADYITINISCPNTASGKTFEDPAALDELLAALDIKADASVTPSLVKFSSDLNRQELMSLLEVCESYRIHGYVVANTSSQRQHLQTDIQTLEQIGSGGLSGPPLHQHAVELTRWIHTEIKGQKPIIGVGGVNSFERALDLMQAGANLIQIYTGLVYHGPGLIKQINKKLVYYLSARQADSLLQLPVTR